MISTSFIFYEAFCNLIYYIIVNHFLKIFSLTMLLALSPPKAFICANKKAHAKHRPSFLAGNLPTLENIL